MDDIREKTPKHPEVVNQGTWLNPLDPDAPTYDWEIVKSHPVVDVNLNKIANTMEPRFGFARSVYCRAPDGRKFKLKSGGHINETTSEEGNYSWNPMYAYPLSGQCYSCGGLHLDCVPTTRSCKCPTAWSIVGWRDFRIYCDDTLDAVMYEGYGDLTENGWTQESIHKFLVWLNKVLKGHTFQQFMLSAGAFQNQARAYLLKEIEYDALQIFSKKFNANVIDTFTPNIWPGDAVPGPYFDLPLQESPQGDEEDDDDEDDEYPSSPSTSMELGSKKMGLNGGGKVQPVKTGSYSGHGKMFQPPWTDREDAKGLEVPHGYGHWQKEWDLGDDELFDPNIAVSEYYLLEGMKTGAIHPGFAHLPRDLDDPLFRMVMRIIDEEFNERVSRTAEIFRRYAHCAIGGELRHHKAMGGRWVSVHRRSAWSGWVKLWEHFGPQLLLDAQELFKDFGGGGYGGPKWASCAKALYDYESGKVSAGFWVDRCANLEHNGGAFMNKISWPVKNPLGWNLHYVKSIVCEEHHSTTPSWELFLKLTDLRPLFDLYFNVVNAALYATDNRRYMVQPPTFMSSRVREYLGTEEPDWVKSLAKEMAGKIFDLKLDSLPGDLKYKALVCRAVYSSFTSISPAVIEEKWNPSFVANEEHSIGYFTPLPDDVGMPPEVPSYGQGIMYKGLGAKRLQTTASCGWKWVSPALTLKDEEWAQMSAWDWPIIYNVAQQNGLVWKKWGNMHGSGWRMGAPPKSKLKIKKKKKRKEKSKTPAGDYFLVGGKKYFDSTLGHKKTAFTTTDKGSVSHALWSKNWKEEDDTAY